jgi:tagaturonate epimerase
MPTRALRATFGWLQPRPIGLNTSAGFGDRLGLATPGHVRALQRVLREAPGSTIAPIFAQQSIGTRN